VPQFYFKMSFAAQSLAKNFVKWPWQNSESQLQITSYWWITQESCIFSM